LDNLKISQKNKFGWAIPNVLIWHACLFVYLFAELEKKYIFKKLYPVFFNMLPTCSKRMRQLPYSRIV